MWPRELYEIKKIESC